MKLVWTSSMNTGIDLVDTQHRRLVDIVNGIYEALVKGKTIRELGPSFKELISYTKTHFSDEQKMMRDFKWGSYSKHESMHKDLTKQVVDFVAELEKGKQIKSDDLILFLKDWLIKHIMSEDKKFARDFHEAQKEATVG